MERLEVLNKSKELVDQIYENMRTIETCDAVAESIMDLDLCFSDLDNKQIVSMEGVLSPEQQKELRETVIAKIYSNASAAQSFLERLYRKPATINPVFEAAVQEMIENNQKMSTCVDNSVTDPEGENLQVVEEPPVFPALDDTAVEDIRRMYQVECKTMKEIATKYGVTKNQVNTFIQKHGLFRSSYKKDDAFLDAKIPAQFGKEGL